MNRIPPPLSFRLGLGAPPGARVAPPVPGPAVAPAALTVGHSHERPDGCATAAFSPRPARP